jgi:hypothetical protein
MVNFQSRFQNCKGLESEIAETSRANSNNDDDADQYYYSYNYQNALLSGLGSVFMGFFQLMYSSTGVGRRSTRVRMHLWLMCAITTWRSSPCSWTSSCMSVMTAFKERRSSVRAASSWFRSVMSLLVGSSWSNSGSSNFCSVIGRYESLEKGTDFCSCDCFQPTPAEARAVSERALRHARMHISPAKASQNLAPLSPTCLWCIDPIPAVPGHWPLAL